MSIDPDRDAHWLRVSFGAAAAAAARGDQPYGAVLVDASGILLAEAGNSIVTTADCTAHAELNLVRRLGGQPAAVLAGATLYASTEPCAMCAGAIYWSGIGRLVFGLSNARLYGEVLRGSPEALHLPSRAVLTAGERRLEVLGPLLEDEAAAVVAPWAASRGR
ncbi:MAG: nucleoside deaminase [Geminicoccaceae bacterium]